MKKLLSRAGRLAFLILAMNSGARAQNWDSPDWAPLFRLTGPHAAALKAAQASAVCRSNLRQLWQAAAFYANDHNDRLPASWEELATGLPGPQFLYCPADRAHVLQTNWSAVDFGAISYKLLAGGSLVSDPEAVLIRCTVHGNAVSIRGISNEARPFDARIPWSGIPTPALQTAKEAAVSIVCQQHLRAISSSASVYALDNANRLPSGWRDFAGADFSVATLRCPADVLHAEPLDFSDGELATSNYVLDGAGASADDPGLTLAHCRIHGHDARVSGTVSAGTDRYPPRLITASPVSRTVAPAHSTSLEVLTGGSAPGPLRFQWRKLQPFDAAGAPFTNTVEIAGATNSTFAINDATVAQDGFYDVIVTDGADGYQLSAIACVRVEAVANASFDSRLICLNNLREIGLAAGLYASSHSDAPPNSIAELPVYLGWPLTLFCPSDALHTAPENWSPVNFDETSYLFYGGLPPDPSASVVAKCRTHGFLLHADGTISSNPPQFLNPSILENGGLALTAITPRDQITALETSSDLNTWIEVKTASATGTSLHWTNANWRSSQMLFYRARPK